jgi:hypothetical protein
VNFIRSFGGLVFTAVFFIYFLLLVVQAKLTWWIINFGFNKAVDTYIKKEIVTPQSVDLDQGNVLGTVINNVNAKDFGMIVFYLKPDRTDKEMVRHPALHVAAHSLHSRVLHIPCR